MIGNLQECPRDRAKVIYLAGGYSSSVADWSLYYCPKCDSPITVTGKAPSFVTCWERASQNAFEPRMQDTLPSDHASAINKLRLRIPSDIARWLARRRADPSCCPNDGARIPRLAVLTHGDENLVIYLWCPWCVAGFAFMQDPDYGWECHVCFAQRQGGYEITKDYGIGGARGYRHEWLRELTIHPPDNG